MHNIGMNAKELTSAVNQSVDAAQAERFPNPKVYETKKLLTKETLAEMFVDSAGLSGPQKDDAMRKIRSGYTFSSKDDKSSYYLRDNDGKIIASLSLQQLEQNLLLNLLLHSDLYELNNNIIHNDEVFAYSARQTVMDLLPILQNNEWYMPTEHRNEKCTNEEAIAYFNKNKAIIQELRQNNIGATAIDALVIGIDKLYDFEIYGVAVHGADDNGTGRIINGSHYISDASLNLELDSINTSVDINTPFEFTVENSTFTLSSLQALQNSFDTNGPTGNRMKSLLDLLDTQEKKTRFVELVNTRFVELVNRKNFRDDSTLTIKEVQEILSEMAHEHISVKIMRQLGEIVAQKVGQNREADVRNLYNKSILINPDKISDIRKGFDAIGVDAPDYDISRISEENLGIILTQYYDSLEAPGKAELLTTDLLIQSFAKLNPNVQIGIINVHYDSLLEAEKNATLLAYYNNNASKVSGYYFNNSTDAQKTEFSTNLTDNLKIQIVQSYQASSDIVANNILTEYYNSLAPAEKGNILTTYFNSSPENKAKLLFACYQNFSPEQNQALANFAYKNSSDALKNLEDQYQKYFDLCEELENATGEHAAKVLKRKIATAVIAFVAAAAALGSVYLGLLEAGIAIGAPVVGTTPIAQGSAFFAQGLEGVATLHNQILATNPTWLIASAVGAVVIAAALVGIICLVSRNSDKSKGSVERTKEEIVADLEKILAPENIEKSEQSFRNICEVLEAVKEAVVEKQQEIV